MKNLSKGVSGGGVNIKKPVQLHYKYIIYNGLELLFPTTNTSSIVDGVEVFLPTRITSSILEYFLPSGIVRSHWRSVLLPDHPGNPTPPGGSPVGTTQQEHYKVSNVSWKCTTVVCLYHRARTRSFDVVFEFTHVIIWVRMSTHTFQLVEGWIEEF